MRVGNMITRRNLHEQLRIEPCIDIIAGNVLVPGLEEHDREPITGLNFIGVDH